MIELLSAETAGKRLNLSRPSVIKLVDLGELKPYARLNGRVYLFTPDQIEEIRPTVSIKPRNKGAK